MIPKPNDYDVTITDIQKRLKLYNGEKIYPSGIEYMFDEQTKNALTLCYDKLSLFLRTTPDFIIEKDNQMLFVEAKQKTTSIEAVGLLFNKQRERKGITVLYSFPDITINATLIPLEEVQVPLKYKVSFDKYLKNLFEEEGCTFNYWGTDPANGSGDPFIYLDEGDLIELAGGSSF